MFSDVSRDCNTIHFKQQNKSVTIFKAINFTVLKNNILRIYVPVMELFITPKTSLTL